MAAIDNAVKHFKDKYELRSFEVPEWGSAGKPLTIYVEPMTLRQQQEMEKAVAKYGKIELLAFIICLKAMDGDRKKIFRGEHVTLVNQADPDVIIDVANKITQLSTGKSIEEEGYDEEFEVDELKKN